jgi:hypothetical protein
MNVCMYVLDTQTHTSHQLINELCTGDARTNSAYVAEMVALWRLRIDVLAACRYAHLELRLEHAPARQRLACPGYLGYDAQVARGPVVLG